MNKIYKNETGFTVVEVLLVALTLAIIGVAGYFVAKHIDVKSTATANTSNSTPAAVNSYAGWKTYDAKLIPVSFKYPANWTLATLNTGSSDMTSIQLNAPKRAIDGVNYQFGLDFDVQPVSNLVGVAIASLVYSSTRLTDSSFPQALFVITEGSNNKACSISLSSTNFKPGSSDDWGNYIKISAQQFDFTGGYTSDNDSRSGCFGPSAYLSLSEVQQAEQVFSTLTQN